MVLHVLPLSSEEMNPTLRDFFLWEAGAGPQNWDSVTLAWQSSVNFSVGLF